MNTHQSTLPTAPRRHDGVTFWSALTLCATALIAGCDKGSDGNTYAPPPPPEVIVANPVERDVTSYLIYSGVVEASEKVEVRARVQGFLESINFAPGQRVKKDDLLFVIDKREYEAALAQNKATAASARATLDLAQTTLERAEQAFALGGTSDLEVREKKAARDEAKAAVDLTTARVTQAELDLGYCEIRSPIEGRISKNLVDAGNLVGRGESTLLAEIVKSTPAFVSVNVAESDVLAIRRERLRAMDHEAKEPGQIAPGEWRPCELALSDDSDFSVKGRVEYVDPQVDSQTGTLSVRTMFENADELLVAGFYARLRFPMSVAKAMLVPEAALLTDQQGRYALIVNDKNVVETRRVQIGELEGPMRAVQSGLSMSDRVIVLGALKARPGSTVTPKTQEPAASGR